MRVTLDLTAEYVADSLAREIPDEDLVELILSIDLRVGDVGFTTALIEKLAASLRSDLSDQEIAALVAPAKQEQP